MQVRQTQTLSGHLFAFKDAIRPPDPMRRKGWIKWGQRVRKAATRHLPKPEAFGYPQLATLSESVSRLYVIRNNEPELRRQYCRIKADTDRLIDSLRPAPPPGP